MLMEFMENLAIWVWTRDLVIGTMDLAKQLKLLNPEKATGPDEIHACVLKETAENCPPKYPSLPTIILHGKIAN